MMPQTAIEQPTYTETELHRFDGIAVAIADIKARASAITVTDHTDREGAGAARALRLESKAIRVDADKLRKELKADALKFERAVEVKAQTIIKPLAEIEAELQAKEDVVAKHAEREAAKERARIAAEQEAERKRLDTERQKLEQERAEIERQKAELERAQKANAERDAVSEIAATQGYAESKRLAVQRAQSDSPDDGPVHQAQLTVEQRALKLLLQFYGLNASGVFTLPDEHYGLITATAQLLQEAADARANGFRPLPEKD